MWFARLFGLTVAAAGAALLVLICSQLNIATAPAAAPMTLDETAGLFGVLLLLGLGAFAVVFGVDLTLLPKSALRRWTPRLPPRPW